MADTRREGRRLKGLAWRGQGQPVIELGSLGACLEHAAAGGLRSAMLGFNIHALFNLVLALIRIRKVPRKMRLALIKHAVLGDGVWRFAAMLGTFTSTYKLLINALPIMIPALKVSEPYTAENDVEDGSSTSSSTQPTAHTHSQLELIRKRTRRWHAALAGALAGGLAIIWQKRSGRTTIAQQLFVRGLQGSYNSYATKRGIHIPHGDVLVFSLAVGQITYGFLVRPDTIPSSYRAWLTTSSNVSLEGLRILSSLVRKHTFDGADLDKLIARSDVTPPNLEFLLNYRSIFHSTSNPQALTLPIDFPHYAPCPVVHPAWTSCYTFPSERFSTVFKWMLPAHAAFHLIPALLFRHKAFMQNPTKSLFRAGWGAIRSSIFLALVVAGYQTTYCFKHKWHRYLTLLRLSPSSMNPLKLLPQRLIDILISHASFWFAGFIAGTALFLEEKRRRGEMAVYVLPKALESAWILLRERGWAPRTGNWGEILLTAIGSGMVMTTYQNDPQHLSGFVRRILYQFVGPN